MSVPIGPHTQCTAVYASSSFHDFWAFIRGSSFWVYIQIEHSSFSHIIYSLDFYFGSLLVHSLVIFSVFPLQTHIISQHVSVFLLHKTNREFCFLRLCLQKAADLTPVSLPKLMQGPKWFPKCLWQSNLSKTLNIRKLSITVQVQRSCRWWQFSPWPKYKRVHEPPHP